MLYQHIAPWSRKETQPQRSSGLANYGNLCAQCTTRAAGISGLTACLLGPLNAPSAGRDFGSADASQGRDCRQVLCAGPKPRITFGHKRAK